MEDTAAGEARPLDLLIIGAGIGGVIALYYARKAGLRVRLLERQARVGGLWAALPPWQDIQFSRTDWTLGDLPIAQRTCWPRPEPTTARTFPRSRVGRRRFASYMPRSCVMGVSCGARM